MCVQDAATGSIRGMDTGMHFCWTVQWCVEAQAYVKVTPPNLYVTLLDGIF